MNPTQQKALFNYIKNVPTTSGQLVGEGCMGKAYKITFEGVPYVLKIQKADSEFHNEITKHQQLFENLQTRPYIPIFYGSYEKDGKGYIVMEYLEGNTLFELYENRQLTLEECQFIFTKLEEIIKAFHDAGFVYYDLAPCNIFIVINKRTNEIQDVKLIDFGATKIKGVVSYNSNNDSIAEPSANITKLQYMKRTRLPRCIATKGGKKRKTRKQKH